jgi:hypothetical protein
MADTRYAPLRASEWGLTTAYTSGIIVGTTDFVCKNDGNTRIHVKKSGAGVCSMIIKTPQKIRGTLDVSENTVSIPASTGDVMIGPFPPAQYNDGNGDMRFNFSEVTGLTFMAFSG